MPIEIAWAFTAMFFISVVGMAWAIHALTAQNKSFQAALTGMTRKWSQHAIEIKNPTVQLAAQQIEKDRIALAARMQERGASPEVMSRLWNETVEPTPDQARADFSGRDTLDEDIDD